MGLVQKPKEAAHAILLWIGPKRKNLPGVCVIDEKISVLVQKKVRNEIPRIMELIEPYKVNLEVVVESHLQLVLACRWAAGGGIRRASR